MGLTRLRAALTALRDWCFPRADFERGALALLREMSAVTRQQAMTAERMAAALEQFAAFYETTEAPGSWKTEDDNALLIEMLTRDAHEAPPQ